MPRQQPAKGLRDAQPLDPRPTHPGAVEASCGAGIGRHGDGHHGGPVDGALDGRAAFLDGVRACLAHGGTGRGRGGGCGAAAGHSRVNAPTVLGGIAGAVIGEMVPVLLYSSHARGSQYVLDSVSMKYVHETVTMTLSSKVFSGGHNGSFSGQPNGLVE